MKKTYIIPATHVVHVELQQMVAASLGGLTETGGTTTLTEEQAEEGTAGWARRGNVWDDDEEQTDY